MKLIVTFLFLFAFVARSQTLDYPAQWPYTQPFPVAGSTPGTTIKVPGTINPSGYGDNASMWDSFMGGVNQRVGTLAERNNIPLKRRGELQTVTVKEDMNTYMLIGGIQNTNWVRLGTVTTNGFSSINIYNSDGYLDSNRLLVGNNYNLTFGDYPSFPLADFTINYFGTTMFRGLSTNDVFRVENPAASFELNGADFTVSTDGGVDFNISGSDYFDVTSNGPIDMDGSAATFSGFDEITLTQGGSGTQMSISSGSITLDTLAGGLYFLSSLTSTNDPTGYVWTALDNQGLGEWQPVSGGTNIYNSDGTLTGDRALTGDGYDLSFSGIDQFAVVADSVSSIATGGVNQLVGENVNITSTTGLIQLTGTTAVIAEAPTIKVVNDAITGATASVGQVLTLISTNGVVDYATVTGGTNYFNITNTYVADNFATTDLTFTGDRLHDVAGYNLSITNVENVVIGSGGGNVATGGSGSVSIGGQGNTSSGVSSFVAGGNSSEASGSESVIIGGNGSVVSGADSGAFSAYSAIVSGDQAVVVGGDSNSATNSYAGVFAGQDNIAGGLNSVVIGGDGNTASGAYSFIAAGSSAEASGDGSVVIGGYDDTNIASGYASMVLSTGGGIASGEYSSVISGGGNSVASGIGSIAIGQYSIAVNNGEVAFTGTNGQESFIPIGGSTSDGSNYILPLPSTSTNSPVMPTGSVWLVEQTVVGMTESAAKVGTFIRRYTISRPTNEASTVILGSVQVVGVDTGTNAGVPPANWTVTIDANTDEGGPRTTVTGDVGDTVRWNSHLKINQVVYTP